MGSRLPAFTPLTGSDLTALAAHADFLLPKIYLWMDGYDGLYGTVYRWAKTLVDWYPQLSESLVVQFVDTLFGFSLPGVDRPADMLRHAEATRPEATEADEVVRLVRAGDPFPEQFFSDVVVDQVQEMIRQVGDPARVCPWVCTSHGGRALTPHELDLLLTAAGTGGLVKYLNFCSLADDDWAIAVKHG